MRNFDAPGSSSAARTRSSPKIPSSLHFLMHSEYIPTKSRSSYLSLAWARQHSSS